MPLDRASVTAASRIMLPAYVIFFGVTGLTYLFTPYDRLVASPSLAYANTIMDLRGWGIVFLGASTLMLSALLSGNRSLYRYALLMCAVAMTVWTAVTILAVFNSPASPSSWCWPAIVLVACIASERSLNTRET